MRDCEKYQELICRAVDDDLTESEKRELSDHTAICPECAELLSTMMSVSGLMAENVEPPKALLAGVMAGVDELNRAKARKAKRSKLVVRWASLAASLAIVFLAGYRILPMYRDAQDAARDNAQELVTREIPTADAAEENTPFIEDNKITAARPDDGNKPAPIEADPVEDGEDAVQGTEVHEPDEEPDSTGTDVPAVTAEVDSKTGETPKEHPSRKVTETPAASPADNSETEAPAEVPSDAVPNSAEAQQEAPQEQNDPAPQAEPEDPSNGSGTTTGSSAGTTDGYDSQISVSQGVTPSLPEMELEQPEEKEAAPADDFDSKYAKYDCVIFVTSVGAGPWLKENLPSPNFVTVDGGTVGYEISISNYNAAVAAIREAGLSFWSASFDGSAGIVLVTYSN